MNQLYDPREPDEMTREADGTGNGDPDSIGGDTQAHHWKPGDPERRQSSQRRRAKYALEHGLVEDTSNGGDRPWKSLFSRSVLWMLLTFAVAVGGWFVKEWTNIQLTWKSRVDSHMEQSTQGYNRLQTLESEVKSLSEEFREDRIDRLEERIWHAERQGDSEAVRYYQNRLRRLKSIGSWKTSP